MAVLRDFNWLGQVRADVPHLRLVEAAVQGDFDALCGAMLVGGVPRILRGFQLQGTSGPASRLMLHVAGGAVVHPTASDAGSIYVAPDSDADEVLGPSNTHVVGAFVPNQNNFIGLDLVRLADDTTSDVAMFLSTTTLTDSARRVPLGRTMTRRIVITTQDPDSTPGLASIARVTTDAANNVTAVTDMRRRMFRLGSGGGNPEALHVFPWSSGRSDSTGFTEPGDKQLGSLKDWADALMSRIWEVGGGERWFSPTADRNVTLTGSGVVFAGTGEYFEWSGTNLHWKGLAVLFDNSTGRINEIADQAADAPGLTNLADGECVYVDLDRTQDRTGGAALTAAKAALLTLGTPAVPGSRLVLAWRRGASAYFRGKVGPVGSVSVPAATSAVLGLVLISGTAPVPAFPVVAMLDAAARAVASGLTRAGGTAGNGVVAIAPDATADTGVTYGNVSMTGGHTFDGLAVGAQVMLVRNRTDSNVTPATSSLVVQQTHAAALKRAFRVDGAGAAEQPVNFFTPPTPPAGYQKLFYRTSGPNVQVCVMWDTGLITILGDSSSPGGSISFRGNGLVSPNFRTQAYVTWPDLTTTVLAESPAS